MAHSTIINQAPFAVELCEYDDDDMQEYDAHAPAINTYTMYRFHPIER